MTRRQILKSAFSATGASLILSRSHLSAQGSHSQRPGKFYEIAEAYEVYSAILTEQWLEDRKIKLFLICTKTIAVEICFQPYGEWQEALRSAIGDYTELIKSNWILQPEFHLDRPYKLLPQETLAKAFAVEPGGNPLYRKYQDSGGRYYAFSPVGFNQDKTVGLVQMTYLCGSLCGLGQFHLLQKKSTKWLPLRLNNPCTWVS